MSAAVAARTKLRGGFTFSLASGEDDLEIRRLLRENPMPGAISLSFEREPDSALAASIEGDVHHTLVARDNATGLIAGLAARSVRLMFVNGQPARVGYLGQLRVARGCRHLRTLLDDGLSFCRALHDQGDAPFYLASLIDGNDAARRLLVGRRSSVAPQFVPLEHLQTFAIPVRQRQRTSLPNGLRICAGSADRIGDITACLQRNLRRYQFAPCWGPDDLSSALTTRGLSATDFVVAIDGQRVVGCAALWDQREFKQVVVRGYSPLLRRVRPLVNVAAGLFGQPYLPALGLPLRFAYVSHIAVDEDREDVVTALIAAQIHNARQRDLDYVVTAFPDRHGFHGVVRRHWRHRAYGSVVYTAHWPDGESFVRALDRRPAQPEVAIL
ncbi:MAG TPA: hypothetical protein VI485_25270 [Vicinamibacterales bacterium]|nr:hypothetical protein [Vicinamibacterales bacterium]